MPGRGKKHNCAGVPVLVTENVQDYRDLVPLFIKSDDVVLELGSAQGCTTSVIGQHAREVVGVDKSVFNANVSTARYPNISFHNLDAFDIGSVLKLGKRFTVLFVDISGSQPVGPVAELVEKYERALQPDLRLIVVKNYKLKRLVGLSTIYPEQVINITRNGTATHLLSKANSQPDGVMGADSTTAACEKTAAKAVWGMPAFQSSHAVLAAVAFTSCAVGVILGCTLRPKLFKH